MSNDGLMINELSRALISNLPSGAAFVVDRDLRYLLAEGEALAIAGFKPEDLIGQTIFEVLPPELVIDYEPRYRKALAGESFEHEHYAHDRYYISRGTPLRSAEGTVNAVLVVSYDITDRKLVEDKRKRHEANLAFLADIAEDFSRLSTADEIMHAVGAKVGTYLHISNCLFAEINEGQNQAIVQYTWQTSNTPDVTGVYRLSDFITEEFRQAARSGETIVIYDTQTDPRVDSDLYASFKIHAYVTVPFHREGEWKYLFTVNDWVARDWHEDEIELIREVTNRTFPRLERARAEAALRESEAKYRSLFTTMDQGFCIIEKVETATGQLSNFRYITVNPAFERHTGLSNVVGKMMREFLPNAEQHITDICDAVFYTGQPQKFEEYVSELDLWFETEVFPTQLPNQIAVLFSNISDRKRAEAQLHRAAEMDALRLKLSDALRSFADPVDIQDMVTRTTMNYFGADRCYYCEIDGGNAIIQRDAAREDLPSVAGVYPLSSFAILQAVIDAGCPFVVRDVYTTDRVDEDLRQLCIQLQVISYIDVPVVKNGRTVGVLCLVQSTPRDWTNLEVELAVETADRTWAAVERARAETALRESEIQRVREQSAREQERQRAEALAELDRAKTLFFSNISHEFRTPLTLSLAPLQDALSDLTYPLNPVHRERLELVHRNNLRLLKLVNTLLDFSRIEAGRVEAVYEPTDLATYTTELASVFRSAIERACLQLIVDCPPLPETVFVDQEMWEKIVLNLLSNAFKFTFKGEITVRLRVKEREDCPLFAILQIQDTGTGIAPEHLPHLFERFYQVRGDKARTYEGSGIGLALVHELVQLHGGTIEVSSTVGEGSCFTITLPFGTDHLPSDRVASLQENHLQDQSAPGGAHQPIRILASTAMGATAYVEEVERWLPNQETQEQSFENAETIQTANSSLLTLTAAQVLVVDDNADIREYLTRILSEYVQVEAIGDGTTALAVAQARVPDLILSDVMMPGLDGFELLKALRADPRTREIPIILLSARAGEEAIVEGLEAGANDYLIKPFSTQELISRVTTHLQMAQLRGEALQKERVMNRQKDEFISVVSHELNTPLVSILGWTRLLRNNPLSPSLLGKALDTIERNATLQGKLVQDLLDLSRITTGKFRLNPQPIELKSVIETAIVTVSQTAAEKGIELAWQENIMEPVVVMGDGDRLQQVICNLLINAIKFTPASGSIKVKLSRLNNDDAADASYAEIRVMDTGIGIAADFLPHLFDRFSQARSEHSDKGLGLGLAIARHIIELHNGTIHAESSGEGRGSTFVICLPLQTSTANE